MGSVKRILQAGIRMRDAFGITLNDEHWMRNRTNVRLLVSIWALSILAGFIFLYREQFTPVPASYPPAIFPAASVISLSRIEPTLILFVHPHCPCTEATFRELDEILALAPKRLSLVVIFAFPTAAAPGWEKGNLLKEARGLSDARIIYDQGNVESRRFNIMGSGHTLIYSSEGRLLFSGGMTASRGHDGDSLGRRAILSLALTGKSTWSHTPVFGCSLN